MEEAEQVQADHADKRGSFKKKPFKRRKGGLEDEYRKSKRTAICFG